MMRLALVTVLALASCHDDAGSTDLGVDESTRPPDLSSTDLALLTCDVPVVTATQAGTTLGPLTLSATPHDTCIACPGAVLVATTPPFAGMSKLALYLFDPMGAVEEGFAGYDASTSMGYAEVKLACLTSENVVFRASTTDGSTQQVSFDIGLDGI